MQFLHSLLPQQAHRGEIRVYGNKSIGMYGKGVGTTVENNGKIYLDGSRATATDKIQSMTRPKQTEPNSI